VPIIPWNRCPRCRGITAHHRVEFAAVGQIVDSATSVFDIVDPGRLWVEALAFDRAAMERVTAASATSSDGRVV